MTRMWMIPPRELCDGDEKSHLKGEHSEMHQAYGTIRNHPHGEAVIKGHADKNPPNLDTSLIVERHNELAAEMERRGIEHESPLIYYDDVGMGSIDIEENRRDLYERCENCRSRMQKEVV